MFLEYQVSLPLKIIKSILICKTKVELAVQTLRIFGVIVFGPREEDDSMNGAGFVYSCAIGAEIYARDYCTKILIIRLI